MDSAEQGRTLHAEDAIIRSDVLLDDYFRSVRNIFARAIEAKDKPIRKYFSLCGGIVELVFPNDKLLPLITPALGHLLVESSAKPSLTIHVWDDFTTGTVMPQAPWSGYGIQADGGGIEGVYTSRGDIRGFNHNRIKAAFNYSANALSLYDRNQKIGYYWTKDARELPAYETSAPVRTILNWWLEELGFHFAHGAAVGNKAGGVLIAGKGGSGKSTIALACLNAGLFYISDDYCVVSSEPVAYSVFSSAKLDPLNIFGIGSIEPARSNTGNVHDDKNVFFLHPQFAGQIVASLPLRAIVLPRITGKADSALLPAPAVDCVKALTLSTLCQFPGSGKKATDLFVGLSGKLPGYYLDFGTDMAQVPGLIRKLLKNGDSV